MYVAYGNEDVDGLFAQTVVVVMVRDNFPLHIPRLEELNNNTTQHNTTQHNTTQHNTTQHNTTQHITRSVTRHLSTRVASPTCAYMSGCTLSGYSAVRNSNMDTSPGPDTTRST